MSGTVEVEQQKLSNPLFPRRDSEPLYTDTYFDIPLKQ